MLQSSRLRSMLSRPVLMKLKCTIDQRNMVCICSYSRGSLKGYQAAKTMSPLVQQCYKAMNDIPTHHSVVMWIFWNTWK